MKRLLLDTHTLLWWLSDDPRLGAMTRAAISDGRNPVFVSAASTWEISIKQSLGKITAPDDIDSIIESEGFEKCLSACSTASRQESSPLSTATPLTAC